MNYEDMSDFEINKKVGEILGLEVDERKQDAYTTMSAQLEVSDSAIFFNDDDCHDYCNNPSDAWPIIVDSDMTVGRGSNFNMEGHLWKAFASGNISHADKNPLRAAMICFLKMKDVEK